MEDTKKKPDKKDYKEYLTYALQQLDGQSGGLDNTQYSLNQIMEKVKSTETVAVLAAQEALQSHNDTFMLLDAISQAQHNLMHLIINIKQNGGGGGSGGNAGDFLSSTVNDAASRVTLMEIILSGTKLAKYAKDPRVVGGTILMTALGNNYKFMQEVEKQNAKDRESRIIIDQARDSSNYAVELSKELSDKRNKVPEEVPIYGPQWEGSPFEFDLSQHVITLQPQSVVNNTSHENSKQEINVYMTNDFSSPLTHVRGDLLETSITPTWAHTLGRSLAEQIYDKLNAGGTLYSNNW